MSGQDLFAMNRNRLRPTLHAVPEGFVDALGADHRSLAVEPVRIVAGRAGDLKALADRLRQRRREGASRPPAD
ncbi:hypothetical protein ACO2Q3_12175 [Caulobacter sp. KR2-114]|uniref:hypothetical protein n=1 Tax=Caulobacter sp. KR2-114 TaxID=3400912 RepID=UPI003C00C7AA